MRRSRSFPLPWVCGAVVLAVVGCGPRSDPRLVKAEETLTRVPAQDPQFMVYALRVAARGESTATERLIRENLSAVNYDIAYAAAQAASRRPSPSLREGLQALFDSKGGVVKVETAAALAKLGDARALDWLRENVVDATGAPNLPVIRHLAAAGDEEAIRPVLEKALTAEDQESRDRIYAVLGEIPAPWSAQLVRKGLEKERGEGRREAIVALGKVGDVDDAPRIERFTNTQGLVFASIEALGNLGNPSSIAPLEKVLAGEDGPVQAYAAVALWKLGQKDMLKDTLARLYGHDDWKVRLNLAEQLATVQDGEALSMLAGLAEDAEAKVKVAAVRALRERGEEGLGPVLLERVSDADYEVAALALEALGTVGRPEAVDVIAPRMDDDNPYVAISAASAVLDILGRVEPQAPQ